MVQLLSSYLNRDKELQFTTASGREFQTVTDLLLNLLPLLFTLKRLILKFWSRVLELQYKRISEPLDQLTDENV